MLLNLVVVFLLSIPFFFIRDFFHNLTRKGICCYRFQNTTWLKEEKVIRGFKYTFIREGIYFQRFQIYLDKKKILLLEISKISWLEKVYVVREFKNTLIGGG